LQKQDNVLSLILSSNATEGVLRNFFSYFFGLNERTIVSSLLNKGTTIGIINPIAKQNMQKI
jgi:hypothetical protein